MQSFSDSNLVVVLNKSTSMLSDVVRLQFNLEQCRFEPHVSTHYADYFFPVNMVLPDPWWIWKPRWELGTQQAKCGV